jgi:hypothetical protein
LLPQLELRASIALGVPTRLPKSQQLDGARQGALRAGPVLVTKPLRAIEQAQRLVLVLSRRALQSDWVRREWTWARMKGRRVSPVLADPGIT